VAAGVATLDGTDLLLTQKEFALLLIFTQNEGRFISSEYLYEKAWKQPMVGNSQALVFVN
jgi:DNA-binding response OmpR family regulator